MFFRQRYNKESLEGEFKCDNIEELEVLIETLKLSKKLFKQEEPAVKVCENYEM